VSSCAVIDGDILLPVAAVAALATAVVEAVVVVTVVGLWAVKPVWTATL